LTGLNLKNSINLLKVFLKMKKIIVAIVAVMLLAGLGTAAKVLAQEFMQVSPRSWVLGSAGTEAVDIHLAVPLSKVVKDDIGLYVYYVDETVSEEVEVFTEISSIGADIRGDLVIKFVPTLYKEMIGENIIVEVSGIDETLVPEGEDTVFEGIEVKENPLFIDTVIDSVETFLISVGKK